MSQRASRIVLALALMAFVSGLGLQASALSPQDADGRAEKQSKAEKKVARKKAREERAKKDKKDAGKPELSAKERKARRTKQLTAIFKRKDKNGDGALSLEEFLSNPPRKQNAKKKGGKKRHGKKKNGKKKHDKKKESSSTDL